MTRSTYRVSGPDDNKAKGKSSSMKDASNTKGLATEPEPVKVVPIAPDGGYGWVIVIASFLCSFIVDGIAYSFGVIKDNWQETFPETDAASVALAGSLFNGLYLLVGPIASALTNAFGFRVVIFAGSVITSVAFILSFFATSIPYLMGTYGVLGGIGVGLIYSPSILCVCYYFDKKRATAIGITVCGSGVGNLAFPPLMQMIIDNYGWEGTMIILAGLVLQPIVAGALMRSLEVKVVEQVVEVHVLKEASKDSNFRDLKHAKLKRATAGAADVEYIVSRHYSSMDGIDIQTMDDQGQITHDRRIEPYRQVSSQLEKPDDASSGTHHEVFHPLDKKDVLVHGSLKYLNHDQTNLAEQEAFLRTTTAAKPAKKSWMPPQLRQALKEMTDFSIYKNPIFRIFSLASFLGMLAFFVPFTFITEVAVKTGSKVDKHKATLLLSAIGGANIFGRLFWGWLADRPRADALLIHNLSMAVVGVVLACVPWCHGNYNSLMAICVIFGFFVAPFVSLMSIILTDRLGLEQLPSAFGQSFLVRGVATLIGTPVGAALYASSGNNYDATFLSGGAEFFFAGIIAFLIYSVPFFTRKLQKAPPMPQFRSEM